MIFKVKITTSNFSESQKVKIEQAASIITECFNSRMFESFVKNHKVGGNLCFHYTNESNEDVYKRIMSGAETLDQSVDHEADIFVELNYRFSWSAIGYTYPNTKWQWIYNRFFSGASVASIASNLAHEYMHKLGYDHEYKWTELREYSVPYAVGYFVEQYAKKSQSMSYFERFKSFFV